jgi:hypothetical protein
MSPPLTPEVPERPSSSSELSREVDLLLSEFDFVLSCRCCVRSDRSFTDEDWACSDRPAVSSSWL